MSERMEDLTVGYEQDGIEELDNGTPHWWLNGFYSAIAFGLGYLAYYHLSGAGPSMEQELFRDMAAAGYDVPRSIVRGVPSAAEGRLLVLVWFLAALMALVVGMVIQIDRATPQATDHTAPGAAGSEEMGV